MYQLIFQKYYPTYNIFSFLLHALKFENSSVSPPFFLLHSLMTLKLPHYWVKMNATTA